LPAAAFRPVRLVDPDRRPVGSQAHRLGQALADHLLWVTIAVAPQQIRGRAQVRQLHLQM
jgi:hypothetical protein